MPTASPSRSPDLESVERNDARPSPAVEIVTASADDHRRPGSGQAAWYVLHSRARQEKSLARTLRSAGVHCVLPLASRTVYHGHRKRSVETPLFPSYVFMHGTREATYFATSTRRIANVIAVADQRRLVGELEQIEVALRHGAELMPTDYLAVGRRVRVTGGPFRGIEGLVEIRLRPDRLMLQVAALGRATSLEIDADLLEPVD